MDALAREVTRIDATLEGAARSTLSRMQDDVKKLHGQDRSGGQAEGRDASSAVPPCESPDVPRRTPAGARDRVRHVPEQIRPQPGRSAVRGAPPEMGTHWVITISPVHGQTRPARTSPRRNPSKLTCSEPDIVAPVHRPTGLDRLPLGYRPVPYNGGSRQRVGTPAGREAAQPPVPPPAPRRHRCRGGGQDALFASVTEHAWARRGLYAVFFC